MVCLVRLEGPVPLVQADEQEQLVLLERLEETARPEFKVQRDHLVALEQRVRSANQDEMEP